MDFQDLHSDEAVVAALGERLRAERLRRNLSQQQLAEQAGVGRMTVQRLEEGRSGSLTSLVRILRALGGLEGLERLLPPSGPSPLEQVGRQGRPRRRARGPARAQPTKRSPGPWRWGDEEAGDGA
jgi:transcriptional regulator with XRE-family HTH domain